MKKLLLVAVALLSTSAFAYTSVSGDKINFQSESTFVSAIFNKSLCFDGESFHATITKCVKWEQNDRGNCLRFAKVNASQPAVSTRQVCADDRDNCGSWRTVRYVQSPVLTVKYENDNGSVIRTQKVTVRSCN